MAAVRSPYNVKDPAEQSRVERYLPAVFSVLYDAKRPLADARFFSNKLYKEQLRGKKRRIIAETFLDQQGK